MNQKAIRKYAEVAAFVSVARVVLDKSGSALQGHAPETSRILTDISSRHMPVVPDDSISEFDAKLDKTINKLTTMMELYIGDDWDNPIEVLEWLSFYAGAAAAHCAVTSSLTGQDNDAIVQEVTAIQHDALSLLNQVISDLGR